MGSGVYGQWYTELKAIRRWTAQAGHALVRTWDVTATKLDTFLATVLPSGYTELEMVDNGSLVNVRATYATESSTSTTVPDPITRNWTLLGSDEEVHLLASARANALYVRDASWPGKIIARARAQKALLEAYYNDEDYSTGDAFTLDTTYAITGATQAELDLAAEYTKMLVGNVDTLLEPRYTLRKAELVSSVSTIVVSHANIPKLHSYTKLVATEPTLPAALLIDAAGLSAWYWLKMTPTVEPTSNGRYQLTQDYNGFPFYLSGSYELA